MQERGRAACGGQGMGLAKVDMYWRQYGRPSKVHGTHAKGACLVVFAGEGWSGHSPCALRFGSPNPPTPLPPIK